MTIDIGAGVIVFFAERIHRDKPARIVVAGTIVMPVKAVHAVEFLAIVEMLLDIPVGAFRQQTAKGIVVVRLLRTPGGIGHHAVAAQMVGEMEMEAGL